MSDLRRGMPACRRTGRPADRRAGGPGSHLRAGAVFAALSLALAAAGCTTLDKAVGKVPWFTTLRDQPAIRPFEPPRTPPAGSVPVTGREDSLSDPVPVSVRSLRRGRQVFEQYCIVCHGPAGRGDGTVVPKFVPPPDLTMETSVQRTDGYLYAVLRQGRGIMPGYGDKIRGADRWHVVNYVRQLQGPLPVQGAGNSGQ